MNYKSPPEPVRMPHRVLPRIDLIPTTVPRRIVAGIEWTSPRVGLMARDPAAVIEKPRRARPEVDPFTIHELERIIGPVTKASTGKA